MHTCWECTGFKFADLPSVQDLLIEVDESLFVAAVLERQNKLSMAGIESSAKHATKAKEHIQNALQEMRVMRTRKRSASWLLLADEAFETDCSSGQISRSVQVSLVTMREYDRAENVLDLVKKAHTVDDLEYIRTCSVEDNIKMRDYPDTYSFEFTSWKKTLAFRVWLGGTFSRKERYEIMADIFCEMTFLGYSFEKVRSRQKKALASIKQAASDTKAGSLRTYPIELFFKRYGLEATTDDYESEHYDLQRSRVEVLNHNARLDLYERWVTLVQGFTH